jgi:hypothetical protein
MIQLLDGDRDVLEAIGGLRAIASRHDSDAVPSGVATVVVRARLRGEAGVIGEERLLLAALVLLGESWLAQHRRSGRAGVREFARTCRAFESCGWVGPLGSSRGQDAPLALARC